MPDGYRSYVIRVRRRDDPPDAVQLVVEELLGGIRIVLTGEPARLMADGLQRLVSGARPDDRELDVLPGAGSPAYPKPSRDREEPDEQGDDDHDSRRAIGRGIGRRAGHV